MNAHFEESSAQAKVWETNKTWFFVRFLYGLEIDQENIYKDMELVN